MAPRRRGVLTDALYAAVRDDVEFVFGDSIDTLDEHAHGVDGVHSHTRQLVLGPEQQFHRYLGYCFAVFTMPNTFGLSDQTVMWNSPGRVAALYAAGDGDLHAFLNFAQPEPPYEAFSDPEARRSLLASVFADAGWEVPGMLAAMHKADDVYFDGVSRRLPARHLLGRPGSHRRLSRLRARHP